MSAKSTLSGAVADLTNPLIPFTFQIPCDVTPLAANLSSVAVSLVPRVWWRYSIGTTNH